MANENEEFEFRLRAEKEAAAAKPATPAPDGLDLAIKQGQEATATTPELIAANPIVRVLTSAAAPVMGVAEKLDPTGTIKQSNQQLKDMQAKGANALGFGKGSQIAADASGGMLGPVSAAALKILPALGVGGRVAQGTGVGAAGAAAEPGSDLKSTAMGGGAGGAITGAIEGLVKTPGLLKGLLSWIGGGTAKAKPAASRPGAEQVAGELQRQRGVLEGKKDVKPGASELEGEIQNLDVNTRPLRDAAFAEQGRIDMKPALDTIKMLEANNPDKKVRAALAEVRDTINNAMQGGQTTNLPAAGSRMTPAQLKAMQGQAGSVNVPMLDEVRQSINRMVSQKGEGALDAHTQEVLMGVRDKLLEGAPQSYRKLLAAERSGRPALDKFEPDQSVLGKVTNPDRGFKPLSEGEAQEAINKALSGARKDRDLRELFEFTKHHPEAAQGFRSSYGKWLLDKDAGGGIQAKGVIDRWESSKKEMQASGIFPPEHFAAIEKVMSDLGTSSASEGVKKAIGGTVGFVLGGMTGHPFVGAGAGKQAMVNWGNKGMQQKIETLVEKSMADPEVARILAGPPSAEARATVERILSGAGGAEQSRERRPSLLGMKAGGL